MNTNETTQQANRMIMAYVTWNRADCNAIGFSGRHPLGKQALEALDAARQVYKEISKEARELALAECESPGFEDFMLNEAARCND